MWGSSTRNCTARLRTSALGVEGWAVNTTDLVSMDDMLQLYSYATHTSLRRQRLPNAISTVNPHKYRPVLDPRRRDPLLQKLYRHRRQIRRRALAHSIRLRSPHHYAPAPITPLRNILGSSLQLASS